MRAGGASIRPATRESGARAARCVRGGFCRHKGVDAGRDRAVAREGHSRAGADEHEAVSVVADGGHGDAQHKSGTQQPHECVERECGRLALARLQVALPSAAPPLRFARRISCRGRRPFGMQSSHVTRTGTTGATLPSCSVRCPAGAMMESRGGAEVQRVRDGLPSLLDLIVVGLEIRADTTRQLVQRLRSLHRRARHGVRLAHHLHGLLCCSRAAASLHWPRREVIQCWPQIHCSSAHSYSGRRGESHPSWRGQTTDDKPLRMEWHGDASHLGLDGAFDERVQPRQREQEQPQCDVIRTLVVARLLRQRRRRREQ
jgi:hypothetical protein